MMETHTDLHRFTKDVTEILTAEELEALRADYDPKLLSDVATKALVDKFPASGLWVNTIQKILFKDPENGGKPLLDLGGRERELCLITLMSAQHLGLELGIHVYWGMMEGLEPGQIAALMTLVGVYAGLSRFEAALSVMTKTMKALDGAAESGETEVLQVVNRLLEAFGSSAVVAPKPETAR